MKAILIFLMFLLCLPVAATSADNATDRSDFGVFIHENPANERAVFDILTPEPTDIRVLIYDNQGNVLFSKNGSTKRVGNANLLQMKWDLNGRNTNRRVAAGTYIVQATARSTTTGQIYQYFAQLGVRR
ncbi:MAG: T9SS type A sorting domain-containing protein [Chitinivibrionia bacterium]|nr:T9SS type A sorting domain-containing protein [Chitinivibrionia bacterium]